MTPISPAPKPEPHSPKKRSFLPRQSLKQQAAHPNAFKTTKTRSKKRERNDSARIYGPPEFVTFLHSEACLGCGTHQNIEQAHRFTGGMGRKGSWTDTVPLCGLRFGFRAVVLSRGCHHAYDNAKQSWSRDHNLPARAEHFWNRWLLHCGKLGLDPQTGKVQKLGAGGAE